jgi:hypothetical protein
LILGTYLFSNFNPEIIAIVFVCFLILTFAIKYYARRHNIKIGPKLLKYATMIWDMLADNVNGPGFILAPFLLGTSMKRLTFMGTMTTITLEINSIKQLEFSLTDLLSAELVALGVIVSFALPKKIG